MLFCCVFLCLLFFLVFVVFLFLFFLLFVLDCCCCFFLFVFVVFFLVCFCCLFFCLCCCFLFCLLFVRVCVVVVFVPLFLYLSSWLIFVAFKIFRGSASFYELRLALFWSLNVSAPILIFNGLLRGFFFDHENIIYASLILQASVAWIVSNMVAEAEGFKSKFPTFFFATLFIALPQYLPLIIS